MIGSGTRANSAACRATSPRKRSSICHVDGIGIVTRVLDGGELRDGDATGDLLVGLLEAEDHNCHKVKELVLLQQRQRDGHEALPPIIEDWSSNHPSHDRCVEGHYFTNPSKVSPH